MQIKDIILYGANDKVRVLSFELGKVNIITGDSKTGKTSIIDIVDYCLGSSFKVAEGKVREYVLWYGVRYQIEQGQILIARPNPTKYDRVASDVLLIQGDNIEIPKFKELIANTNADTLLLKLSNIIGIRDYKHTPNNLSRPDVTTSFKHSRYYCFQPQTDIDQRDFLFYNQKKEYWVEQSMKDTLPYFLGAIDNENIKLEQELAEKTRNLNRLNRELKQAKSIMDKTLGQVFDLVNEAKQVGLIQINLIPKDKEEALNIINSLSKQDDFQNTPVLENELLIELQNRRDVLNKVRGNIIEDIKNTEIYQRDNKGYESETLQQALRLESIELFSPNNSLDNSSCPLCDHPLSNEIPTVEEIKKALFDLKSNLNTSKREQPRLDEHLSELKNKRADLSGQITDIEKSINVIYKEREEASKIKDLNVRKGRVLGRISLYLESKIEVSDFSETNKDIKELELQISKIKKRLSPEQKEEKLEGILDQINVQMTNWSKELELEFKDMHIKFDIKKLTLFLISPNKKISLDQTGSGENWVAYHLLIHFALHKFFILNNSPVPNFLILDQFSQAYFPPEKDIKGTGEIEQSEDDKAIKRLFQFIFNRTLEMEGKLQTIVIDHARINQPEFINAITEEWRKGVKLIPLDWIDENDF